jgi:hypothetical protein
MFSPECIYMGDDDQANPAPGIVYDERCNDRLESQPITPNQARHYEPVPAAWFVQLRKSVQHVIPVRQPADGKLHQNINAQNMAWLSVARHRRRPPNGGLIVGPVPKSLRNCRRSVMNEDNDSVHAQNPALAVHSSCDNSRPVRPTAKQNSSIRSACVALFCRLIGRGP